MTVARLLISLPPELVFRLKKMIPDRQRSKVIQHLIESEVSQRESALNKAALSVEKDSALHQEMQEWGVTLGDGLDNESW